jgi:hypothetical protein
MRHRQVPPQLLRGPVKSRANIALVLACGGVLVCVGALVLACGDSAVKEDVARDSGTVDGQSFGDGGPQGDGGIGPDGAPLDDCVANPDPNSYTDLLNACTTSFKIDPHPTIPLRFPDGGLPPLP